MSSPMTPIHGAPTHTFPQGKTTLALTLTGGHLTAEFTLPDGRLVAPYALAPWTPGEVSSELPVLLTHLRGDFFCLPFGPQQDGPPHGDPANADWTLTASSEHHLLLTQQTTDTKAQIEKRIETNPQHTALYLEHKISGLAGRWSYGSHPILDLSALPDGAGRVTVSPFRWASTYPGLFSDPANHEHQALAPSQPFTDLTAVPLIDRSDTTDLTRYPARPGHDDLVMMVSEPTTDTQPFAWTAVVLDGYLWFCLKDPADFPSTLFWISNGGREDSPWDSRHTKRLGLEEVCSHFCDSVEISREDRLASDAIPTTREFRPDQPTTLRLIQAVAAIPEHFGAVASITPKNEHELTITSERGLHIDTPLNWSYLAPTRLQPSRFPLRNRPQLPLP